MNKAYCREDISFVIYSYLRKCSIKVTLSEVALSLETHPGYPSVWAISQTLKHFGDTINNLKLLLSDI